MFGFYWLRDQFKLAYIWRLRRTLDRNYRAEAKKLEEEGIPAEEIENTIRAILKGELRVIAGESHALWSDQVGKCVSFESRSRPRRAKIIRIGGGQNTFDDGF
jgi:hypothetical protein